MSKRAWSVLFSIVACGCGARGGDYSPTMWSSAAPTARLASAGAARSFESAVPAPAEASGFNREAYAYVAENPFVAVADQPLSTFSIDVDTASYSNVRRMLVDGQLPPPDAVRIEELLNYFDYDYPEPVGDAPVALYAELSSCPWNPKHQLLQLGVQAKHVHAERIPARNLVFLLDVSGSMADADKLPLLKQALTMLTHELREEDRVAIVVYAGASGLVLDATSGLERGRILAALSNLDAGGSTNGGEGIQLAYQVARRNFISDGINRVILATDGDFNVGLSSEGELVRLIEHERESSVFLTVLGFGTGNLQDDRMEALADHGNGNYAYIDSAAEAHKVLVREAGATLVTLAKDVKIQLEMNPRAVQAYRLVGYENRLLAARDFNDDKKDAGELGAGHSVTALYEIVPATLTNATTAKVDPLRYQGAAVASADSERAELALFKLRYKTPTGVESQRIETPIASLPLSPRQTSERFRFAAAVANFGLVLRGSVHAADANLALSEALAQGALGQDAHGDRRGFLDLIAHAARLDAGHKPGSF